MKDYSLSMVRFGAMLTVIFCHLFEQIGFTLGYGRSLGIIGNFLAVGVQIFLLLSGYLYGRRLLFEKETRLEFVVRNFKKILLDYYVYVFCVIIPVYLLWKPESITIRSVFCLVTCSGTVGGVGHLWFIPYILVCYLLTPLLFDIKAGLKEKRSMKSLWQLIFSVLVIMGGVEVLCVAFNVYFIGTWINCYIVGFFLPDILSAVGDGEKIKKQLLIFNIIAAIPLTIVWYEFRYVIQPQFGGGIEYKCCGYVIDYCRSQAALTIAFLLYMVGHSLCENRWIYKVLAWSDRYSFDIYICHMIFITGSFSLLRCTGSLVLNVILIFVSSVGTGVLLNVICRNLRRIKTR